MSLHAPEKSRTSYTDKQWKVEGGKRGENHLNLLYKMLLLPALLINKLYNPRHKECDSHAN